MTVHYHLLSLVILEEKTKCNMNNNTQWKPSKMDTIGEVTSVPYEGGILNLGLAFKYFIIVIPRVTLVLLTLGHTI